MLNIGSVLSPNRQPGMAQSVLTLDPNKYVGQNMQGGNPAFDQMMAAQGGGGKGADLASIMKMILGLG